MSFLTADRIKILAETLDTERLSTAAARVLAPHVEVRLREIVQEATKFARHAKRAKLSAEDINSALKARNVEPTYGFSGPDPKRFIKAANHSDLYYIEDPVLSCEQVIEQPLPKLPAEVGVALHWLAINGVQPAIPENAPVAQPGQKRKRAEFGTLLGSAAAGVKAADEPAQPDKGPKQRATKPGEGTTVQLPLAHVLSRELQTYYDRVTSLLLQKPPDAGGTLSPQQQRGVFASLATDPGLHPLVPYFMKLIAEEVPKQLQFLDRLQLLLRAARSLLSNDHINCGLYIHVLMPALLSSVLAKRMGSSGRSDHWIVRQYAADTIAQACAKLGQAHANLQPRVTKEYVKAFSDEAKPPGTHYGAIVGLAALGPTVVRLLLVPLIWAHMHSSRKHASSSSSSSSSSSKASTGLSGRQIQADANRVQQALCHAACSSLFAAIRKDLAGGVLPQHTNANTKQQLKQAAKQAAAATSSAHTQAAPSTADTGTQTNLMPDLAEPNPRSTPQLDAEAIPQAEPATPRRSTRSMARKEASPLGGAPPEPASPTRGVRGVARRSSSLSARKPPPASPSRSQSSMQGDKQSTPPLPSKLSDSAEQTAVQALEPAAEGMDIDTVQPSKAEGLQRKDADRSNDAAHQQAAAAQKEGLPEQSAGAGDGRKPGAHTEREKQKARAKVLQGKAVLAEAWREDSDPGRAVMVLRELFGEWALPHFWGGRLANMFL